MQAFGHHDDIGGACPGSMPSHATSVFEEGLMVPADPAVGRGRAQRGGAGDHDPQLPDAGVAGRRPRRRVLGLPDGRARGSASCSTGTAARRSRPASTRSSTAPPRPTAARSCPRSPTATYVWEDYAEHDGVDEPRLHTQRITLTRTAADDPDGDRLVLDFTGTGAAGQGPDQPLRRLRRRRLPQEVAGADPAQPRRHPRADGRARRQRGRRAADRDAVPASRARC